MPSVASRRQAAHDRVHADARGRPAGGWGFCPPARFILLAHLPREVAGLHIGAGDVVGLRTGLRLATRLTEAQEEMTDGR